MRETKKTQPVEEKTLEETEKAPRPLCTEYFGTVVNCERLNLRKNPRADAKVVDILNKGAIVVIHKDASTPDYYAVSTETNEYGFCYKDYIEKV